MHRLRWIWDDDVRRTACPALRTPHFYYQSIARSEQQAFDHYLIVELIRQKRTIWKKGSGHNLFACLQEDFTLHGISIGRDKFFEILRENGLLVRRKSKRANNEQLSSLP